MRYILLIETVVAFGISANKLFESQSTLAAQVSTVDFPRQTLSHLIDYGKFGVLALCLIHYILNDFVLLILNVLVDLKLLRQIKSSLKQRKEFNIKLLSQLSEHDASGSHADVLPALRDLESSERNSNKLIIYILVFYLFCRLPELAAYFFIIFYVNIFVNLNLDHLLITFVRYFYVISYSFHLTFYIKFNSDFKKAFKNLFTNF